MWYIEMGGVYNINGERCFGRKIYVTPDKMSETRKRFNNTDVYATVFSYNAKNQNNSDLFGPLYLDLDLDIKSESDYIILKKDLVSIVTYLEQNYGIPSNYIKFYFTGKKGFHLLIPSQVFDLRPDKNLNTYYKEIAKELNLATITNLIDTKIYDKKRLLRLPNSINGKTGLYKVPVTYSQILSFSFEKMKEYATSPKPNIIVTVEPCEKAINRLKQIKETIEKPKVNQNRKPIEIIDINEIKNLPDCIVEILKNGAVEGNRNNTTIILASAFLQQGASYQDTLDLVTEWNERTNTPALPESEINITVASAYQQVQDGKRYGCTSIKECDLCVGRACRLFK